MTLEPTTAPDDGDSHSPRCLVLPSCGWPAGRQGAGEFFVLREFAV